MRMQTMRTCVPRVTGDPLPGDTLLNPNNTGPDFDVYGTDLGLMWHLDGNRVGMFFGDTSGEGFVVKDVYKRQCDGCTR